MAPVLVPMRPSSEHILIVRAPGARNQHGCHSIPFIVGALRARRAPGHSPLHSKLRSLSPQGWGLSDLPLRATFSPGPPTGTPRRTISPCEGFRAPRVARAQKITRLHPLLCSASRGTTRLLFPTIYPIVPPAPTSHGLRCRSLSITSLCQAFQ